MHNTYQHLNTKGTNAYMARGFCACAQFSASPKGWNTGINNADVALNRTNLLFVFSQDICMKTASAE